MSLNLALKSRRSNRSCGKSSPASRIMKQFILLLTAASPLALAAVEADVEADPRPLHHAYGHRGRAHHAYGHNHVAVAHHTPAVAVALKCHTVYDTVTSSTYSTVSEPVCSTRSVISYETKHEQKCSRRPVGNAMQCPGSSAQLTPSRSVTMICFSSWSPVEAKG